ncbi:MAG: hypothetical protein EXR91_00675 [Gemmatimonadetes bacterium]|nr:hypothetical protein [Gemmatimonadota bacterium]
MTTRRPFVLTGTALLVVSLATAGWAAPVQAQDSAGRITVRATRAAAIELDGRLDEPIYQSTAPMTGFIQQLPDEGAPASERTEAWVFFDDDNLYVSARNYDSAPPSEWVANEMRRDANQLRQNDSFSVLFDTFLDRRNGSIFLVTPIGGFSDVAVTNEGANVNADWNVVWDSRTGRFDGGWTVEIRVPFRSLRYRPGPNQSWGFQLRRIIRRRNEASYLTALPISAARGNSVIAGIWRVSQAATLEGVEVPARSLNVEVKPYAIGGLRTDRVAASPTNNDLDGDVGVDVKYGLTSNLTVDATYNTDFAQVEVDEQQVNLTRFNLFFPEKREFFLEGRGNFDFTSGSGAPTMFFSRRIGLQQGRVVPILYGARVTGKVGAFDVGVLNMHTDASDFATIESTNFTVVRLKRDVLSRSTVGALFTNRSRSLAGDGSSQLYGVDGSLAFRSDFTVTGYLTKTDGPVAPGRDLSYMGQFAYAGDRYGLTSGYLVVEDNFTPEVGFLQRDDFRQYTGSARISRRPTSPAWVRRVSLTASTDYLWTATGGELETRQHSSDFTTELESSDQISLSVSDDFELLTAPFTISPGVILPPGEYDFTSFGASYTFGQQRPVSGALALRVGDFWSGTNTSLSLGQGRIEVTPQVSLEPSYSMNWVNLPEGDFDAQIVRLRLTYTLTPRMFLSGLSQYSTSDDTFSANFRFRWEWSAGSELFVVYSEDRDTDPLAPDRTTELRNRGLVIKVNRLLQF